MASDETRHACHAGHAGHVVHVVCVVYVGPLRDAVSCPVVYVATLVGIAGLVVGLLVAWPVLVALSAIFTVVQVAMIGARTAVQRNDRRMAERLAEKRARHGD